MRKGSTEEFPLQLHHSLFPRPWRGLPR
uniref:Uncharacterized protein n=1 Tax=Anguilla anguilla TaxID=7936 RepID=A0A0E9RQS1_ANGAN